MENIFSFFDIEYNDDFFDNIFKTLKNIINFKHASISYSGDTTEYEYGTGTYKKFLKEDLKIKNIKFGEIEISSNSFSKKDENTFKSCAVIISNIIKDYELSKIMKMQVEALQEGYLKVKQSDEVKTKFISNMSHELRTPLNSILGYSSLLEEGFAGSLNEKQKEYLNDIKISGLNLLGMINEILDMSKIEAGALKLNISEFNINQAINEIENTVQPLIIKKNLKFIKSTEDFSLQADYQKFQQILLNLLSNAIKFTKNRIYLSANKQENHAVITVKDNGIGILKECLNKIFDKFEQLNSPHENSTGLGLTIAKEFISMHNGKISVNSEINKGTEFIFKIPLNI